MNKQQLAQKLLDQGIIKNINEILNTKEYSRLRFGVGSDFSKGRKVDYVFGNWSDEESKELDARLDLASEMILSFTTQGAARTMYQYNNK